MTNEEMERVMNFIIERQEVFADQMAQSDERLTRLERVTEHQQGLLTAVIETQDRTSRDVQTLTLQVDRIVEAVAVLLDRTSGTNGSEEKS